MNAITLTPSQLSTAQTRGTVALPCGRHLDASQLRDGAWRYVLTVEGSDLLDRVAYADPGLVNALEALNEVEE
jgi:hypothetical protein